MLVLVCFESSCLIMTISQLKSFSVIWIGISSFFYLLILLRTWMFPDLLNFASFIDQSNICYFPARLWPCSVIHEFKIFKNDTLCFPTTSRGFRMSCEFFFLQSSFFYYVIEISTFLCTYQLLNTSFSQ